MPRLLPARLLPHDEAANGLPAWRWHLGFDLLAAGDMAVATASTGMMAIADRKPRRRARYPASIAGNDTRPLT
jgi:hypothetical protein